MPVYLSGNNLSCCMDISAVRAICSGGIRTSKTVNGVTTEYLIANGSVLSEKKGSEWQHYLYHADGMRSAIRYKGADYYYVRNGLTNIVGLVDSHGNRVVSCEYDSWGKILGITGSMAGTLGQERCRA